MVPRHIPATGTKSIDKGIAHEDRVLTLRAGRQHRDRRPDQLFEAADAFDRGGRQIGPGTRATGTLAPTLGGLANRLELGLGGGAGPQISKACTAPEIG